MKTITITVPEDVARSLREAGMLAPEGAEALEALFRYCLRRYKAGEVIRTAEGSLIQKGPSAAQEEVDAVRTEAQEEAGASWLPRALRELDGMDEEIEEEGLPEVNEVARSEARKALIALSRQSVAPMVCPTEDGEVSVYFKAPGKRGALHLLFDNDGAAAWFSVGPGKGGYGRHKNAADLPIDFLIDRLRALGGRSR